MPSQIIHKKCVICDKLAEVERESRLGQLRITTFKCGHIFTQAIVEKNIDITSLDGKKPYPYQTEGARFVEASGGRALIADEMGLGKTIQALLYIATHDSALPCAVFCKSGLKLQWCQEIIRWCGDEFIPQVIETSKEKLLKGFKIYVFSLDMLRRFPNLAEEFERVGIKTIIIDECQLINNSESSRTQAVRSVCKIVDNIIGLSGTPIKNHAGEYFPILNILRPEKFPVLSKFLWNWCDSYFDGYKYKTGGIKYPERFAEYTRDFIIRRERKQVLPDLPSISRNFQFCELGDEVEEAYKRTFKEFQDYYNEDSEVSSFERSSNILAFLTKMRHLTGIAKIDPVVEFVADFLDSTDRKITLFVHHKDVGLALSARLTELCSELSARSHGVGIQGNYPAPLQLTADLDSDARNEIVQKFMGSDARVLIASTLASGEGLNLQNCSDCILVERQWNPANEEQAEARFIRIGQLADKVTATYFVAVGTVDEFFSELVERKREICATTMGGEAVKWDESSLVRDLAEVLAAKGGRRWGW